MKQFRSSAQGRTTPLHSADHTVKEEPLRIDARRSTWNDDTNVTFVYDLDKYRTPPLNPSGVAGGAVFPVAAPSAHPHKHVRGEG